MEPNHESVRSARAQRIKLNDASDRVASSFRDPSGFVFKRDGILLRQVNRRFQPHYAKLIDSGLYGELSAEGLLIPHEEAPLQLADSDVAFTVLRPEPLDFISYPYEWCFSQLKDAALLTLDIARRALDKGLILKDASAYNVQFKSCKPIFIDTLSFEIYEEGRPWIAYRQFCRHFLAPLALMALVDVRLGDLLATNLDGIPLSLASRLLPASSRLRPGLLAHIHLHAKADAAGSTGAGKSAAVANFPKTALYGLLANLGGTISGLNWSPSGTEWASYYTETNYTDAAMEAKKALVSKFIDRIPEGAGSCWDLGANTGAFGLLAASRGFSTVLWDADPAAVEKAYLGARHGSINVLPLRQDLTNPSPDCGWANAERDSLIRRGPVDLVLVLALVHHLAITHNIPMPRIAEFLAATSTLAIVEFIPKEDGQVQRLLGNREDIFDDFTEVGFRAAFEPLFTVIASEAIIETKRTLFLLRRRD